MINFACLLGLSAKTHLRKRGTSLILFVHGLGGSPLGTWKPLLTLIKSDEDFESHSLDCYAYPTSLTQILTGARRPGIRELADGLKTYVEIHHPDCEELYLVGHSLGGLVIRQFLIEALNHSVFPRIKGVLLYAVPNTGSQLARISDSLSWHNIQAKQLVPSSDMLDGLNRDWLRNALDSKVKIEYAVGGADQIVPRESSAWSQLSKVHTIIGAGHRNIVKPASCDDTSYLILKAMACSSNSAITPATNDLEIRPNKMSDPLFDVYSLREEKYYLERKADHALGQAANTSHVWVYGPSGAGKTAALKRLVDRTEGTQLAHIMLSGYGCAGPNKLMSAILTGLYERLGRPEVIVDLQSMVDVTEHLRKLYAHLDLNSNLCVLIEEIPLGNEEIFEFMQYVYQVVFASGIESRVTWLFSSIYNPVPFLPTEKYHLFERLQFLQFDFWSEKEITRLLTLIRTSKAFRLNPSERKLLVTGVNGSPRILKLVLRRWRSQIAKKLPITTIIDNVKKDLGQ